MTDAGLLATVQGEVGERYRVLGSLGTGGSGETFEATRVSDGIPIALKRLVVAKTREWKTIELFEREARVLANLAHPGIPVFRESFVVESEVGTCLYLANDLAPGRSLRAWMDGGWRADPAEVLAIAEFLLGVLAYLHALSPPVVHRDIKPDNIIRSLDGRLWLVDFGAVRDFTTTMGGSSTVVGTYGYMAPEQFRGQAVPASDIYSVAATLLHLMTGRSPHELPQAQLKVVFRPQVQAPERVLAWLDRALAPVPEDRFPTAAVALGSLRLGSAPVAPAARPKTSRTRVALLLCLLTAIGGGAAAFIVRDVRASRALANAPVASPAAAKLPPLPTRPAGSYHPLHFVRTFEGHMSIVLALALSPDGKIVASSSDGSVKLWDTASGVAVRTLQGHIGKIGGLAFTKDGKQIVTGDSTTVRIFDVESGAQLRTTEHPHGAHVMDVVLSPDGKTLYTAGRDGIAKAWELETGKELRTYAHGAPVYHMAISPNGVYLVTGAGDGSLKLWNASTGANAGGWGHRPGTAIGDIAFSPDGSLIATAGDDHVVNVSAFTSRPTVMPRYTVDFTDEAWGTTFTPDGRFLVSAGKDHAVRINDALQGGEVARIDAATTGGKIVFSSNSHSMFLAAASWVQHYTMSYRGSGTKLPEPSPGASDELPRAKNRAHGLYLEAMSLMMRWPVTSLDDASAKLDEAAASDARSPFPWVGRAQLALKRGYLSGTKYDPKAVTEAKAHLERAASLGPKSAEYWSVAAFVAAAANDLPGMQAAIRETYALVPGEPYATLAEASHANRDGRPAAAIEAASRVVKGTRRADMLGWAYQFLADAYVALGDIDAADAAYRKQIELAPQNVWKRSNYSAFLLTNAGEPERAVEAAEAARAIADSGMVRHNLAIGRVERGNRYLWEHADTKRALADYDAALAISPSHAAHYGRAACFRYLAIKDHDPGLVDKAREALLAALKIKPDDALAARALKDMDRVTAAAKAK